METVVISLCSIHTISMAIPTIAYGADTKSMSTDVADKHVVSIKAKAETDKVGLQDTKSIVSKSTEDTKIVMSKQIEALKEAKIEDERRIKAKEEEEIRIKEEEVRRLQEEEAIRKQQEEMEKRREASIEKVATRETAVVVSGTKMVVGSVEEALEIDIRTPSNWTASDFEAVLPDRMKVLIPVALDMERDMGINALYLISVGINETGWGRSMAGHNNYFNWTNDGINHFNFDDIQEFENYSIKGYKKYLNPDYYIDTLGSRPDKITLKAVNSRYAINLDGSVNWIWTDTVSKVMNKLSDLRLSK